MAVVATVLAIACLNLAGLLMARGMGRRGEFAVRAALGASRGRLVRQLAIESFVLSSCAGAAGLVIAYWATQALVALSAGALTAGTPEPIRLDASCFIFTFAVSTLTALAFGLLPARQASHVDPQAALRERTRGATPDRRHHRVRRVLVVTEVALAVVLLVGAGLLLRTLSSLARVNLGFQPAETVTMGLFLGLRPPETRSAVIDQILDRVEGVPGVKAAGTIQFLPLRGMTCGTGFWLEEQAAGRNPSRTLPTECALVSRGYFAAMGIPVLDGRPFDHRDRIASPRVLVVNQAFAKRYFPDGRVIGRRILVQASNQALADVIGVVGDVRHTGLTIQPSTDGVLAARANAGLHHESRCPDEWRSARPCNCAASRHSRGRPHASSVGHWDDRAGRCEGAREAATASGPGHMFRGDLRRVGGDRSLWAYCLCCYAADSRDRDSSRARGDPGAGLLRAIRARYTARARWPDPRRYGSGRPSQDCLDIHFRRHDRRSTDVSVRRVDVLGGGACSRHHSCTPRISD